MFWGYLEHSSSIAKMKATSKKFLLKVIGIGLTQESIPKYLTEYELALLQLHSANLSIRDRTIFNFLLTTGCQSVEVSGLNIEDIDLRQCRVMVKGKGMKRRLNFLLKVRSRSYGGKS